VDSICSNLQNFDCLQGGCKSSGDGGPTQRASAMAALTTALNPSSKPSSPQPQSHSGQGSQRAAAVAALSNVLTAEGSSQSLHNSRASPTEGRTCQHKFDLPFHLYEDQNNIRNMSPYPE
jgi:hypothetical protein